ncbi:MAG TPA: adenylate/guanylate cyclase domain-containing protein [Xanthomonadaceae bacterium]|jgi:adenylate cyclase
MPIIRFLPDNKLIEVEDGETVLAAALRAGIAHVHACGRVARCSTCRVEIREGIDACAPRTPAEQVLARRLGFHPALRMACQTAVLGDVTVRRLVLDDDDVALLDQQRRDGSAREAGHVRRLAYLFTDIRGFARFSEPLPPYDVIHVLNRYFHLVSAPITRFDGSINNYMGDRMVALFGLKESTDHPALSAVRAGLAMLEAAEALKRYLSRAYGNHFDIGIGVHFGDAVVGSIGEVGHERVTAIGEAVNFASQIESADTLAGSRMLVSDAVREQIGPRLRIARSLRVPIAGKSGEFDLHDVTGLNDPVSVGD